TTPQELDQKLSEAATTIAAAPWPEETRQTYIKNSDGRQLRQKVEQLLTADIDVSKWTYKPLFLPLYRVQEPIREPELEPVLELVADYGRALIEFLPEGVDYRGAYAQEAGLELAPGAEGYDAEGPLPGGPGGSPVISSDVAPVRNSATGAAGEYP